jgi:hypothetical protein
VSPSHHLKTETFLISETLCFLVTYNSRRWPKCRNPIILYVHQRQNPLDSAVASSLSIGLTQARDSSIGIATNSRVFITGIGKKCFPSPLRPDGLRGQNFLASSSYKVPSAGGKAAGA